MLSWVVDHAFALYLLLLCAGLVLGVSWWTTRRPRYLTGLGVVAGLAALVWLLSLVVDTDRRQIVRALEDMAAGVEQRDLDRTFAHIADDFRGEFFRHGAQSPTGKRELRELAQKAVQTRGVEEVVLRGFEFEAQEADRAVVFFTAKPFGKWTTGAEYCGCRAEFRKRNGRWLLTKLELFQPGRTEPLDLPL